MLFSQRKGLKPVKVNIQIDGIDSDLRNALWDALQLALWEKEKNDSYYDEVSSSNFDWLFKLYWHKYFKKPVDSIPQKVSNVILSLRSYFFECEWHEVYDLIEFTAKHAEERLSDSFVKLCNIILERELSGYRLIDKQVVEITSEEEISSIEAALDNTSTSTGARAHLQSALALMADRKSPDYRNSIKESISAVEAICQHLTKDPKATLGAALKKIEGDGKIHPALKASLSSLYGYTSDSDGIRHAMLEEQSLSFTDAKFMLVSCTAFINYMISKASE